MRRLHIQRTHDRAGLQRSVHGRMWVFSLKIFERSFGKVRVPIKKPKIKELNFIEAFNNCFQNQ